MTCNASRIYRSLTGAAWLGLALGACSNSHDRTDPTGGALSNQPARDAGTSSDADGGTGEGASSESDASVPSASSCGNGNVEAPEECDPPAPGRCDDRCRSIPAADGGPPIDLCGTSGFDPGCRPVACGNGFPQGDEECDDGNVRSGDGCDATCRLEGCGNGRLEPNEDCEPPGEGSCDAQCHPARTECGDGTLQPGEECDDGNVEFGDGCSPACLIENCGNGRIEAPFETCEPPGSSFCGTTCRAPTCGDGRVDRSAGEQCEDGNLRAGDGCNPNCQIEACGNGVVDVGEQCEPPGTDTCTSQCQASDASSGTAPAGPLEGQTFLLQNSSFSRSLTPWEVDAFDSSAVQFGTLDAGNAPGSASAQVNLSADSPDATLWQCVRTGSPASYQVTASTRGTGSDAVPVELGVSFYEEQDCSGEVFDGVRTLNVPEQNGRWSNWTLPPPSPVANLQSAFDVPEGAQSMMVWIYLEQDTATGATSLLVDDVRLLRVSAVSCGDGVPESPEECEPSVSPNCLGTCLLPRACGDGVAAPGECASCPADCNGVTPACGDHVVTPPEQCEPPGVGACRADCSWGSSVCGNGRIEGGETCDPPNGDTCGSDCTAISCGNRRVEPPEDCDPPGTASCSAHCRLLTGMPNRCGDGVLQGAEQCDPPNSATWCSKACQRRDPRLACGDGVVDAELEEECDPPGTANNCGSDCRVAQCGDNRVGGGEECDPPNTPTCSSGCKLQGAALTCRSCLGERCGGNTERDPFAACLEQPGFALDGPAQNAPRSQLCSEALECMRATGCATEKRAGNFQDPAACYCGKAVLALDPLAAVRGCRDGTVPPEGPCRRVFEEAAESTQPSSVLAALVAAQEFPTALSAAIDLMQNCGSDANACQSQCTVAGSCGNGVVEPGELCEPSNNAYCAPNVCAILPCGNGVVDVAWPYGQADNLDPLLRNYQQPADWLPETCDVSDPFTNQGGKCDETCHLIVECGDGQVNPLAEGCDPGGQAADWSECCMPKAFPNAGAQLASCDRNGNGQVDRIEQCQVPAECGNGKREGAEECDLLPEDPSKCVACKAVDACSRCTREKCESAQHSCFESPTVATRVGCGEVLECHDSQGCGKDRAFSTCLCGDHPNITSQLDANGQEIGCGVAGPLGPCADVIKKNLPCGDGPGAEWFGCVINNGSSTATGSGAALQVTNCRHLNCASECNYVSSVPSDE